MPLTPRFFVLTEPLPASEIPHLLGRVVEDKLLPNRSFAPFPFTTRTAADSDSINTSNSGTSTSTAAPPPHNPEDIIPDLLPEPLVYTSGRDFSSHTSRWSLGGGLAQLLGLDGAAATEHGIQVESEEIKSYSLSGTLQCFARLMENPAYAADVRALLDGCKTGHGYFVTGFLTARGGVFTSYRTESRKVKADVTVPVLEIAATVGTGDPSTLLGSGLGGGVPGDPRAAVSRETVQRTGSSRKINDEVIFAVAYDVIKGSRSLDLDSRKFKKTLVNAGPKKVKPNYLGFGEDEDEDEDDFVAKAKDTYGDKDSEGEEDEDDGVEDLVYVASDVWNTTGPGDKQEPLTASFRLSNGPTAGSR